MTAWQHHSPHDHPDFDAALNTANDTTQDTTDKPDTDNDF
jgi:hypothetical protein